MIFSGGIGQVRYSDRGLQGFPGLLLPIRAQWEARLVQFDPATAATVDLRNRRRVIRALEIYLLTGQPAAMQRMAWSSQSVAAGVFVFRERADLYERINQRVERMLEQGVLDEVRDVEGMSATAAQTLGLTELRELAAGRIARAECVAAIQQATRRYAKRQLTWFRRQTSFESLNLSLLSHVKAVEWITKRALPLLR